ncbi:MAG: hypothetical protein RIQ60_402 [Pseudomonadota bacterium]|jgi:hypothetical protein
MTRRAVLFSVALLVLAGVLAAVAWTQRDAAWMRRLTGTVGGVPGAAWQDDRAAAGTGPTGVHKCRQGQAVIYVNVPCPNGSQPLAMDGGAVTLVPAHKAPPPVAEAGSRANVRDLLVGPGGPGPDLREQMMERAIEGR